MDRSRSSESGRSAGGGGGRWSGSLQFAVLVAVVLAFLIPSLAFFAVQSLSLEQRARVALESDLRRHAQVLSAALRTPLWELAHGNAEAIVRATVNDERFVSISVVEETNRQTFVAVDGPADRDALIVAREEFVEYNGRRIGRVLLHMSLTPYLAEDQRRLRESVLQLALVFSVSSSVIVLILRRRVIRRSEVSCSK